MAFLPKNEIMNFMKRASIPCDLKDAGNLEYAANANDDEGAEWLPWYKMSLSCLAECCGILSQLHNYRTSCGRSSAAKLAAKLWQMHLMFSEIGPRWKFDDETFDRVRKLAEGQYEEFLSQLEIRE